MQKLALFLGAIVLFATAAVLFQEPTASAPFAEKGKKYTHITPEVVEKWQSFKKSHKKDYQSVDHEVYRMQVFLENLNTIEAAKGETYTLAVNQFADLTNEEWRSMYLGLQVPVQNEESNIEAERVLKAVKAPASVNWVTAGNVPPILNQAQCGSCWAFSAAGSLSCAYNVKQGGNSVQLSPEQLVQCSKAYGNNGCNGGWMNNAFNYAMKFPLATNAQYPYTSGNGVTGTCNTSLQAQGKYPVKGIVNVPKGNTDALKNAVAVTPVSIAVDASKWQLYSSGVFSNCGKTLDHGVILVGYTATYWYVRNSWGTTWGQSGYIQLAPGNTCGLADAASYPTI